MTATGKAVRTKADRRAAPRAVGWTLCLVAVAATATALFYFTSAHLSVATSDSATIALEGQSLSGGHLLLHGWDLTFASYWTSAALVDAVLIALGGLRASVLYLGPALDAAIVVALGIVLAARDGGTRAAKAAGAAAIAALLCLGVPAFEFFLVGHGFHVGTVAYALAAFVALHRPEARWRRLLAVVLLAAGSLGDLLMLAWGPLPLALAGMVRPRSEGGSRLRSPEVTAALASVVAAAVARLVLMAAGAYVAGSGLSPASPAQILRNIEHLPAYATSLIGLGDAVARSGGLPGGVPSTGALGVFDCAAALLVLASFVVALGGLVFRLARRGGTATGASGASDPARLDDLLVFAVVCSVLPFLLLAEPRGAGIRYLVATVVFAVVIAGRLVSQAVGLVSGRHVRRLLAVGGAALVVGLAASFAESVSGPSPVVPAAVLAHWLDAHDLRSGLGDYWTASLVTVESGGAVAVRPVLVHGGRIERRDSLSAAQWYARRRFQFLVYGSTATFGVGMGPATATWGPPEHRWRVGRYTVVVWARDLTVSPSPAGGA